MTAKSTKAEIQPFDEIDILARFATEDMRWLPELTSPPQSAQWVIVMLVQALLDTVAGVAFAAGALWPACPLVSACAAERNRKPA